MSSHLPYRTIPCPYSIPLYPPLHYPSLSYPALLHSTLPSPPLYFTLSYFTSLNSVRPYLRLLSALPYPTLPYPTLHSPPQLHSTPLHSTQPSLPLTLLFTRPLQPFPSLPSLYPTLSYSIPLLYTLPSFIPFTLPSPRHPLSPPLPLYPTLLHSTIPYPTLPFTLPTPCHLIPSLSTNSAPLHSTLPSPPLYPTLLYPIPYPVPYPNLHYSPPIRSPPLYPSLPYRSLPDPPLDVYGRNVLVTKRLGPKRLRPKLLGAEMSRPETS